MSYTRTIVAGFRRVARRLDEIAGKTQDQDQRLAQKDRQIGTAILESDARLAPGGSVLLPDGQLIVVRTTAVDPDNQGIAIATVQKAKGLGEWEDDLDSETGQPVEVRVRGYPAKVTSPADQDWPYIPLNAYVLVRWAGYDAVLELDWYHLVGPPPPWSGQLIDCDLSVSHKGWGQVKQVAGEWDGAPIVSGAPAVMVALGKRSHIRKGKTVQLIPSGVGMYPHWFAFRPVLGIVYKKPTTVDSSQTVPDEDTTRCSGSFT